MAVVPQLAAIDGVPDDVLRAASLARVPVDNTRLASHEPWQEQLLCGVLDGQGLYHTLVVPLCGRSRLIGALYLARSATEPAFSGSEIAALTIAQQHVQAALARAIRHEALDRHTSVLAWALDQLDTATSVTALDGRTVFENKAVRRLTQSDNVAPVRIAELIAANLRTLAQGQRRVAVRSDGLTADRVLTIKSTAMRPRSDVVLSFVFVRRKGLRTPVDRAPLSSREREIVSWVADGLTNRQIADRAFISENTVREHLKRIFGKLDVHNRAQLIQALWQGADESPRPGQRSPDR